MHNADSLATHTTCRYILLARLAGTNGKRTGIARDTYKEINEWFKYASNTGKII
jgi:hypothetical protein